MPYRRTLKTHRRKFVRRRSILQAALSLFGEIGYDATTVAKITSAARTGTGTFYRYFRNKEDIFTTVLKYYAENISDALSRTMLKSTDPRRQLQVASEQLTLRLTSSPFAARLLLSESCGIGARIDTVRRLTIDHQASHFERALARLVPPPQASSAALLARCCVGTVYESVRHWLELPPDRRTTPQALATNVAAFNLQGAGIQQIAVPQQEEVPSKLIVNNSLTK